MAAPKGNIPRIKQKIEESELENKAPGGKYLKDMLRATAYYKKENMKELCEDLCIFVEAKKGTIIKFVTKSTPFSVMIVTQLNSAVLCEYQIKTKDTGTGGDSDEQAKKRNNYNHLLYEFERAESVQDLINTLQFTTESLKIKKQQLSNKGNTTNLDK